VKSGGWWWLTLTLIFCCAVGVEATAQTSTPDLQPESIQVDLPAALTALLAQIADNRPNFDHPAYYALVRFVRDSDTPPEALAPQRPLSDWSMLAERPSEYRGSLITIRGTIGRNKSHRYTGRHADLGQLWQLELSRSGQAMSMTVICTDDVGDLPINGEIVISGYYLMLRQYQTTSGKTRYGGLMVARGPTSVATGSERPAQRRIRPELWIGSIVIGLLIAVVLMRRGQRSVQPRDIHSLRAEHGAPVNLADDLAEWSKRDLPESPDEHELPEHDASCR
jgi:hypothetical protein